ncbi:MAG: VWA domain-containing protein [Chloroflexota bacterium]
MIDDGLQDEMRKPPPSQGGMDSVSGVGDPFAVRHFSAGKRPFQATISSGRRTRAIDTPYGPTVRAVIPGQPVTQMSEVAVGATIRAAAVRGGEKRPLVVKMGDVRRKVRAAKVPNLILFVVDASGSMAARQRMGAVKGAILSLLIDAYQKRDMVGLIQFRGQSSSVVLPPTNSVTLAHAKLAKLPTGGRTPLADGLLRAHELLLQGTRRQQAVAPLLVLLTDGRGNVGAGSLSAAEALETAVGQIRPQGWKTLVVDCEAGYVRLGLAKRLAARLGGEWLTLEQLSAEHLTKQVRRVLGE